ncbi:MAG: nucleotidyltransferase domain-containing protein [Chloroflexota bacterium]
MSGDYGDNPNAIVPAGTNVVTLDVLRRGKGDVLFPRGAVGVVVNAPVDATHAYRVRFLDGSEHSLRRAEFAIQKAFRREGMERDVLEDRNLYDYVIYRCVTGSRAYGLANEDSDWDRRGIYLPPAHMHWSLYGVPEQLEGSTTDAIYWELQKFIRLALKANPNILETLYTPMTEHVSPLAQELLDMRKIFLSTLVYTTYNGYVMSQFRKLQKDLENHGEIRWKHAMHLIRLLLSGITVLREGFVVVDVGDYREKLLTIRRGELPWDEINGWRLALHKAFDAALETSPLPERPDYEAANDFLVRARQSMV